MSESSLNNGRRKFRFDEMATMVNDRVDDPSKANVDYYVGLEHLDSGSLTIRRWGSPRDVEATKLRFRVGDIIFGRRRVYQRKLGVAHFDGICSAHAMVLRAKPEVALSEFLPFFMQGDLFMERAKEISVGSLSPSINWTTIAKEEFEIPSLNEQRRLVGLFVAMDSAVEAFVSLESRAKAVERALLFDAFGPVSGSASDGVELVPLSEIAEIRTGLAKGRAEDSTTTKRPYLRVANVKDGALDLTDMREIVVPINQVEQYTLRDGDVLMTEGGDLDKLGRGTVWQNEVANCLHQNHVFVVRTYRDRLDPWFLAALARSSYGRQYFLSCAKRTSNLASVNKRQVGQLPVPLIDIDRQTRWVALYRSILESLASVDKRIAKITALRRRLVNDSVGLLH